MVKKEGKEIVFCQGDKKELEQITGKEYEHINPLRKGCFKDVMALKHSPLYKVMRRTYLEGIGRDGDEANCNLYSYAREVKADAVIHYSISKVCEGTNDGQVLSYAALGTPVKKKKGRRK